MRIALLSRNPTDPPVCRASLSGCAHDIRYFNVDPHRSLAEPQLCSYADIAALYPQGWRPDVFLHWSLEYNPVPVGIEEADCLTVATVGDWNLGGQSFQALGGAFDLLIADRNGCERLRQVGFANVAYVPLWGYDPNLHRILPDVERDLDIVMVGNFNHEVQRERSRWLARVAKLSQRYRVCLTSNVYGEAYTALLNRAKIVFNRSIRGEINMRVYETLACGALLFNESENTEIRQLLTDGVHCVLYTERDLEALLDYYLAHSEAREPIALAGMEKIAPYTNEHIYRQIYAIIEARREDLSARRGRRLAACTPAERQLSYARQRLTMPHRRGLPDLAEQLAQRQQSRSEDPEIGCARACALAEWALGLPDMAERRRQLQQAIACVHQALREAPDQITLHFNLAQMYLALDRTVAAMNELQKTLGLLGQTEIRPAALRGPLFPRRYDAFLVDLEAIYASHQLESPGWTCELTRLLRRRALEQCCDLALRSSHSVEALAYAESAVALDPGFALNQRRMARALRALGRTDEAATHYRRALEDIPLDPEVWSELATLLMEQGKIEECWSFLEEINLLLEGCPVYDFWKPTLRALVSRLSGRLAFLAPAVGAQPSIPGNR